MKRTRLLGRLGAIVGAAVFAGLAADPAAAQTQCALEVEPVGTVGSVGGALTGGSTNQIWVIEQCVHDDGQVATSVVLCEMSDDVDTNVPAKCSAPALLGDAVSRPQN